MAAAMHLQLPAQGQRNVAAAAARAPLAAVPRLAARPFTSSQQQRQRRSITPMKVAAERINISIEGESELPAGYTWYETMIILRPTMNEEQRDVELAKFEAFLKNQNVLNIKANVRGRQRLAYPIKRFVEGIYVLYTYAAPAQTSQLVQKTLSMPDAGNELNILRHMTFRV